MHHGTAFILCALAAVLLSYAIIVAGGVSAGEAAMRVEISRPVWQR